jgi:hypothetical protein
MVLPAAQEQETVVVVLMVLQEQVPELVATAGRALLD